MESQNRHEIRRTNLISAQQKMPLTSALVTDANGIYCHVNPYSFISSPGFTSSAPGTSNFFALAASYSFPGDICTGIECFAAISSAQCIVSGMSIV